MPDARLAELLQACPSALLVFDDGTTLPASKELLMLQSPVLRCAITASSDDQGARPVRVALPGDSRADWVAVLPYLYSVEAESTWDTAGALAGLLHKYELAALRLTLGRFLLREAEAGWGACTTSNCVHDGASARCAWRWLVHAANCRIEESVVQRMCKLVMDKRVALPAGFDLGLAAHPLAVMLVEKARHHP